MIIRLNFLWSLVLVTGTVFAQDAAPKNWFHLDPSSDNTPGVSTDKTYEELLKGKEGKTVIVAVLDSGVDAEHEDLKDVMWVNVDEIPDNGIDDDNNGYIDDIHGWNFIGNKNGENIHHDNLEVTRLYVKYKAKYEGKDPAKLSKKDKIEYDIYQDYSKTIEEKRTAHEENVALYGGLAMAFNAFKEAVGKEDVSLEEVKAFKTDDPLLERTATIVTSLMEQGQTFKALLTEIEEVYEYYYNQLNYYYNPEFDPRATVGDNIQDPYQKGYGNNDVEGPDAEHGTHVAGIIAASRQNEMGMDGIADKVKIMSVRTVPDGDERDKDVANAIIYAVDNGASIINMSFGKGASPYKEAVDKAIKYALKNDVLLVHAAGNDAKENTFDNTFPNDKFKKKGLFGPKYAANWLEVGALNYEPGEDVVAPFSNYSQDIVDVFAPGVEIYSTTPDDNYRSLQGTSFASPVVAGVAAVLRSYYPDLTAVQVKDIIMQSAIKNKDKVKKPGAETTISFSKLSVTGGMANLYEAVKLAQQTKGKKKGGGKGANGGSGKSGKKGKNKKEVAVP